MSEVSLYLSYDVLRSWPQFVASEDQLAVGTRVSLDVSMTGVSLGPGREYVIGQIGQYGIRFDRP